MTPTLRCYRPTDHDDYVAMCGRLRATIGELVPSDAQVAVASRGDDQLLQNVDLKMHHFPRTQAGIYAGCYPVDGVTAVTMVKDLAHDGIKYFSLPATGLWWLDYYRELKSFLQTFARTVYYGADVGAIYELPEPVEQTAESSAQPFQQACELVNTLLPPKSLLALAGTTGQPTAIESMQTIGIVETPSDQSSLQSTNYLLHQVEKLGELGARFLVLFHGDERLRFETPDLMAGIARHYDMVLSQKHVCSIFDIGQKQRSPEKAPQR